VALIDLSTARKIINMKDRVSGIVLKLDDMFAAPKFTGENGYIAKALSDFNIDSMSWIDRNQVLFKWMKLEKWAAFIMLSLIIIVAAFNIISSQIMTVMDKTREIGILKSMGATKMNIMRIFVYQGAFVGISGTMIGGIAGIGLSLLQDHYRIISLPADIYFVSSLPMDLQITDVIAVVSVAMLLCWFSSVYPAKKAAELVPVDAIRSE
jgi:lipoprotein-releasing system permease protein